MRSTIFIILFLSLNAYGQERPVAIKYGTWHVLTSVVFAANHVFDSIGNNNFPIDTAFVLNDSIVSLRGRAVNNGKKFSDRLFVRKINDTLWTRPDPYIQVQYFSCSENDCCLICDKGATACVCSAPICQNGKCTERTYGVYPLGGLSNAVRKYIILSNGGTVPED